MLDPPISFSGSRHSPLHIMLKINRPISDPQALDEAAGRAKSLFDWPITQQRSQLYPDVLSPSTPPPFIDEFQQHSRSWNNPNRFEYQQPRLHQYRQQRTNLERGTTENGGGPPPIYLQQGIGVAGSTAEGSSRVRAMNAIISKSLHFVPCQGCGRNDRFIQGIRWLCAHCPTGNNQTYDLVSPSE